MNESKSGLVKAATTPHCSRPSAFDSLQRAARRLDLHPRVIPGDGRTLILSVSDASPLAHVAGIHRVQRIPRGSAARHTSTCAISVVDETSTAVELVEGDLEETFTRGTGNGGQNRNVHDHCVVLRHVPSGITVRFDERSQWDGRRKARAELARRLEVRAADGDRERRRGQRNADAGRAAKMFTHNEQRSEVTGCGFRWSQKQWKQGRIA